MIKFAGLMAEHQPLRNEARKGANTAPELLSETIVVGGVEARRNVPLWGLVVNSCITLLPETKCTNR